MSEISEVDPVRAVVSDSVRRVARDFQLTEAHAGKIRKLLRREQGLFRSHLMRLDAEGRRMRFAHPVADSYIEDYAARMSDMDGIVYGFIVDGEVRAVAELRKLRSAWGPEAEAAFSVEAGWRNQGIATLLMGRIIRAGRNRGVRTLIMSCLVENTKMQAIARRYRADLSCEAGSVMANIVPARADYYSILAEAMEDRVGVVMAALDLQSRLMKPVRQKN